MLTLLRTNLVTKPLDRTLYSLIQVKTVRCGIERTQRNNPACRGLSFHYFLSIHIKRHSPFRALASLIRRPHTSPFSALLLPSSSVPLPCSKVVVYLFNPSEASLRFPERKFFSGVDSSPPRPTPQPGGPGCPFLSGSSPLTFPALSSYATAGLALSIV